MKMPQESGPILIRAAPRVWGDLIDCCVFLPELGVARTFTTSKDTFNALFGGHLVEQ